MSEKKVNVEEAYPTLRYRGRDNYIWEVNEGATWTVVAPCEDEALLLVIKYAGMGEGVRDLLIRWADDGVPDVNKITEKVAKVREVYDEDDGVKRTLFDDFKLNPATRLMGCSEW